MPKDSDSIGMASRVFSKDYNSGFQLTVILPLPRAHLAMAGAVLVCTAPGETCAVSFCGPRASRDAAKRPSVPMAPAVLNTHLHKTSGILRGEILG